MIDTCQRSIYLATALYSIMHAVVDATCSAVVLGSLLSHDSNAQDMLFYIVLYNVLAFALQAPFGIWIDMYHKNVVAAVLGCLLTAAAAFIVAFSTITVVGSVPIAIMLAGLGNALFHVGGGVAMLGLKPGSAAIPGIYVAPGAVGLLIGTLIGKGGHFSAYPFILLLLVGAVLILAVQVPQNQPDEEIKINYNRFELILVLLFISVGLRSLVGITLNYDWKTNVDLLVVFTLAVAMGKAVGGVVGDKFGWMRTTILGLILSAPLLYLGFTYPMAAIIGVFLFNLTMPITLTAMAVMLQGRTGFAFGLTTLALLMGSYPKFLSIAIGSNRNAIVPVLVLAMALILFVGLHLFSEAAQRNIIKTIHRKEQLEINKEGRVYDEKI